MKGIILAGGSGTRLYPITEGTSKQLVPVYDKPMIYYPLSVLMEAGIRDILIITTPEDQESFKRLLGDGSRLGINLNYTIQPSPDGLAQAFILGREFIGDSACAMVLGDNIFYGSGLTGLLQEAKKNAIDGSATIFGYQVKDPERFGIMEFNELDDGTAQVISVEEKPEHPKSNLASMGIYIFNWKQLRKELISDMTAEGSHHDFGKDIIPNFLNADKRLYAYKFEGYWKDVGTIDSLWEANMDLLNKNNELNLDDPNWKIYTEDIPTLPHYVGPTGKVEHCYINQGAVIRGHAVDSVLFNNVDIDEDALVSQAVLMPNVKVGKGAKIYRAIVADGVKIDDGAVVGSPDSEEIVLISKRVKKGE